MSKEKRIKELTTKYKKWNLLDNKTIDPIALIARDEKRKIAKIFQKEIHEKIDNYL